MSPLWGVLFVALGAAIGWYLWERAHRRTRAMQPGLQSDITLPFEDEFELYHNALSLCSKKVRVCMAELGVPYKSHPIDLIETGSYENIGRAFLRVNPGATVPVLVHHGHPVYESHEQIRYAAEHALADSPHLIPDDPALREEMDHWVDLASLSGDNPIAAAKKSAGNSVPGLTVPLFAAMMEDIPTLRVVEGLLFHRLKSRPLIFLAMKRAGIGGLRSLKPALNVVAKCRRHMHGHLDTLESKLERSGGPWILGEIFSLADVSWVVILERLIEGDSLHVFLGDGKRPAVTAYWERLKSRPSYKTAILDHAHPTVTAGIARLRAAKQADPALRAALEG